MKPLDVYAGHQTYDLTECKVHVLPNDDGSHRIVARYPAKWIALEKRPIMSQKGEVSMRAYLITEWTEVELQNVPAMPG